jgi:hypothetical protein
MTPGHSLPLSNDKIGRTAASLEITLVRESPGGTSPPVDELLV